MLLFDEEVKRALDDGIGRVVIVGAGNAAGLLPGVDWRGRGGYVVAAPSVHPDGHRYLVDPEHGLDTPLEAAPDWLWATRDQHHARSAPSPTVEGGSRYGTRALEAELGRIALAAEGTRNDELCRAAFRMGRLVAGGELEARTVAEALLSVVLRIGLTETEAVATIRSGLTSGMEQPRSAPERAS